MRNAFRRARPYAAAFLLPSLLFLCVCALCGVSPFGQRTLLLLDMRGQYVPFLGYLQRMLQEGNDWFYSLSASPGGNMFALGATYLFSPLNLLVFLFPRAALPDAILALALLKIGLCGLTAFSLLRAVARRGPATLFFSTTYALMGYVAVYFSNIMWLDGLVLLPLVAAGIRRLVARQSAGLYLAALAMALFSNYYTGYMLCLFSPLFFVYCCLSAPPEARGPGWFRAHALRFALSSLAAGGLAAFTLLPTFFSLSGTKAGFDPSLLSLNGSFPLQDLFQMLTTDSYEKDLLSNTMPFLFCGAGVTALAVLYFLNRRISRREKLLSAGLATALLAGLYIKALNLVWHAFNPPNLFFFRQSFLLTFCLIWLAYRCFARADGIAAWHVPCVAGGFTLFCLLIRNRETSQNYADALWMCAFCALLYAWLTRKRGRKILLCLLAALQCAHLLVNDTQVMGRLQLLSDSNLASYQAAEHAGDELFSALRERDGEDLYRVDSGNVLGSNSPMLFSRPGVSFFSSTHQVGVVALLRALGYGSNRTSAVFSADQASDAADSLLGVRYVISAHDLPHKQYPVVLEAGDWRVYENACALPLGFAASPKVLSSRVETANPCFALNEMYAAIAGDGFTTPFVPLSVTEQAGQDGLSVRYLGGAAADGPAFAFIEKLYWTANVEFFSEGRSLAAYDLVFADTLPLSDYGPGDEVELLAVSHDKQPPEGFGVSLYQEDLDAFDAWIDSVSRYGASIDRHSSSHLSGTVILPEARPCLLLTLPYDPQWRAWVDGQEVRPAPAFGALMALEAQPGEHAFELRFRPRGFTEGCALSLFTLCAVMARLLWRKRFAKKY